MKTPMNKQSIRQHFTYAWWKYALLAVIAIFGWNLIYTVTAYQPPANKKIDLFIYGYGEEELLDGYMETIRQTEMSDMEQMDSSFMLLDDSYTPMQIMTYIAAGEGHLYMLPKDYFQNYAGQAVFLPLEDVPGLIDSLAEAGISVDRGWRTDEETREKHLYGIPMTNFPGFAAYAYGYEDSYLCISVTNRNDENSIKFLQIFLEDMLEPPVTTVLSAE